MLTRRTLISAAATTASGLGMERAADAAPATSAFGVQSFTFTAHLSSRTELRDPLTFLRFCRERGAGGVQTSLSGVDPERVRALRQELDETGAWIEGSVRLPTDEADLGRFEQEIRTGKEAGATVFRTVMLAGRRYEQFRTAEEYRAWAEGAVRSVELAARVVARGRVRLAVENHKDFRSDELVALMRRISGEWLGVTLDTGNNLALLEEPRETLEALTPFAWSVHLKDMAVEMDPAGFRIAEVPFGTGVLDLPGMVAGLRKARPGIRFNIEMSTRDPLLIPCLEERYWNTFAALPGTVVARMLRWARDHAGAAPLPRPSLLTKADLLQLEDRNARACLRFAREKLAPTG